MVRAMPKGLIADQLNISQRLYREANRLIYGKENNVSEKYCDAEHRQALKDSILHKKSNPTIQNEFGVTPRTLQRSKAKLREHLVTSDLSSLPPTTVSEAINAMEFPNSGPIRFLTSTEALLVAGMEHQRDELGLGSSKKQIEQKVRTLVHEKGQSMLVHAETLADKQRAEAFVNAKISKGYFNRNFGVGADDNMKLMRRGKSTQPLQKNSNISRSRAMADNAVKHRKMLLKVRALFEDHYSRGLLATPVPERSQFHNFDEVPMQQDQEDNHRPTFTLGREGKRGFRNVTNERSQKHTTIGVMTTANGKMAPWAVIHESKVDPSMLRGDLLMYVPSDWFVGSSDSGYMTVEEFERVMWMYVNGYLRPDRTNCQLPHYIFLDGHYSHFSSRIVVDLQALNIHFFFLQSQNSINDQPNDNGPNALIAAIVGEQYGNFRDTHPNVPIDQSYVNMYLAEAYRQLQASRTNTNQRLQTVTKKGWAKTFLYPFVIPAEVPDAEDDDEEASAEEPPKKKPMLSQSSRLYNTNPQQIAAMDNSRPSVASYSGAILDTPPPHPNDQTVYNVSVSGANPDNKQIIQVAIGTVAAKFLNTSFVIPATEISEELDARKKAKKTKINKAEYDVLKERNTIDTSTGCSGADMVAQQGRIEQRKSEKALEVLKKGDENTLKKANEAVANEKAKNDLLNSRTKKKDQDAWRDWKAPALFSALKGFLPKTKGVMNKPAVIQAIQECLDNAE